MSYRLVKGEYAGIGGQPDGDSIRFRPDNEDLLKNFPQGDAEITKSGPTQGTCQLRFEGVDALELHYTTPADHQEINAARRVRDFLLLDLLTFDDVQFNTNETVTSSVPPAIPGYILTNGLDNAQNRRPVSFLFTGAPPEPDGSNVFVEAPMLTDSVNARLLSAGEAYPLFYNNLPAVLRDFLTNLATQARSSDGGLGLWSADKSLQGIEAHAKDDLQEYVFFPKLYRRLKDYFQQTGADSLSGFDSWVRADPIRRDDSVWIDPLRELRHLHSTYEVSNSNIKMLYRPEDLVFQSQSSLLVAPATPISERDCPPSHPVKGNQSGIYHDVDSPYYDATHPEVCFVSAAAAEAAGYRSPK